MAALQAGKDPEDLAGSRRSAGVPTVLNPDGSDAPVPWPVRRLNGPVLVDNENAAVLARATMTPEASGARLSTIKTQRR